MREILDTEVGANPLFAVLAENRELAQVKDKGDFKRLLSKVFLGK